MLAAARLHVFQRAVRGIKLRDLLAKAAEKLRTLDSALDDQQQLRVVPWLLQILKKADFVDRLNCALLIGVTGQQYSRSFRLQLLRLCRAVGSRSSSASDSR